MPDFTLDDLEPNISQFARDVICDLILSWAKFDSLVSQLTLVAFGLSLDGGTIMLGAMDTRSKLDKLKKLYDHHQMEEAAQSIANLRQSHKEYVDIRNSVAHHTCAGSWKSRPEMIVFAPVRAVQGSVRMVEVEHIPLREMINAVGFAEGASNLLLAVTPQLTDGIQHHR